MVSTLKTESSLSSVMIWQHSKSVYCTEVLWIEMTENLSAAPVNALPWLVPYSETHVDGHAK